LNLPGKTTQIQMGMCVYQGGKQNGLIMVPRGSPKPLAAEQPKGSHVQNLATGHHYCAIFNGRLAYGDDQSGPVENRTGITPRRRLGDAGTGRIEVYVFSGHSFPAGSCQLATGSRFNKAQWTKHLALQGDPPASPEGEADGGQAR